jgi:putative membrane protein insertion efficiency factor
MASGAGRIAAKPVVLLVKAYRYALSPWLGVNCRYEPSCSAYAIESLERHGLVTGLRLAAARVARCHPWGGSGYDPVPAADRDRDDAAR